MLASLTAETETGLILRAQQGDRNAFGELVRSHYPKVVRVVYRLCGDTNLAEDTTQEAFIRAWAKLSSFLPGSSFRNWIYRIAVNAALDVLRRRPEEALEEEDAVLVEDMAPGPEKTFIQKEQAALVQQAINSLPDAARTVVVLREYGELSYREIAAVLDIPLGTVMSRLNYARSNLRELLEGQLSPTEADNV